MIQSRTTRDFRDAFASLPNDVRRQAQRAYRLFRTDPRHPGLRFKKVDQESNVYSVRIGLATARSASWKRCSLGLTAQDQP